jgi:hypothetical protein
MVASGVGGAPRAAALRVRRTVKVRATREGVSAVVLAALVTWSAVLVQPLSVPLLALGALVAAVTIGASWGGWSRSWTSSAASCTAFGVYLVVVVTSWGRWDQLVAMSLGALATYLLTDVARFGRDAWVLTVTRWATR